MKPKLNLMSMAELSHLIRNPLVNEHLRERALDELNAREKKWHRMVPSSDGFSRFNYATV